MRPPRFRAAGAISWDDLRAELHVPTSFPAEVLAEAEAAAAAPRLPALDLTALSFLTIDPAGSLDLDQAMCLERDGTGFTVRYAIADVGAFVVHGSLLDAETHARGETSYFPDLRVPLHPPVLAEGAGSLLPDQIRPAVVWTLSLDAAGELVTTEVRRATVRSQRRLEYVGVQQSIDDGTADEQLLLLREIGTRRQELARARGAVDLPTPEQEVTDGPDGRPCLQFRAPVAAEAWNAQISLLTGIAAAHLMLDGGVGLLRTLPPADDQSVASLRRSALALGVPWPKGRSYGEVISALDSTVPAAAALLTLATRLLRGAAYTAFDGAPPKQPLHSAVAAAYAHCTAPLRRLADRYVNEVCLALCAGEAVPDWARAALPDLPAEMAAADKRAHEIDRAIVDLTEAVVLAPRMGEVFQAVVVDSGPNGGAVQLTDPAVRARCDGADLPLGERISVVLEVADPKTRQVSFRRA
ncbi:MAG: RNB domain-containing ribonuclease [Frankiaceae bacterium]|nr:RNB domain-containing ribonuclease [Frankiaceae bacterium]